jgi:hypothetical protein
MYIVEFVVKVTLGSEETFELRDNLGSVLEEARDMDRSIGWLWFIERVRAATR